MLECPPACHPRQFSAAHAIGLASSCHGGQKVEEIDYDLVAGFRVDAEGNEGVEGVPGKVGVCMLRQWIAGNGSTAKLTRLANAKQLVGVPCDDAAGQSTPAPFHYAAQDLYSSTWAGWRGQ